MRLLFVADGRSPTAASWISYWVEKGHETRLVSTYPCQPLPGLASFHVLPVAFGSLAGGSRQAAPGSKPRPGLVGRLRGGLRFSRYYLGPLTLPFYARRFQALLNDFQPELVHALRIPFEGMLAGYSEENAPLVVSIWGNDLTLHARGSFLMAALTRRVLRGAAGLMADTHRDITLAQKWGFPEGNPSLVVPGSGGIRFTGQAGEGAPAFPAELPQGPIVVNPRGQRPGSLRQDVFFQSIPLILQRFPQAKFICPSLAGDPEACRWVESLGLQSSTWLWPRLDQATLWALMRQARVFISPSLHDGTPNSLLEAMTCGCFPVVGNIEPMREWIVPGENGLLVDATSTESIAQAVIRALEDASLRQAAKKRNASIIAARAEYGHCMAMAEAFYMEVVGKKIRG